MFKFLLLGVLMAPLSMSAQNVAELEKQKKAVTREIRILQDSLETINKRLQKLTKKDNQKDDIEVAPEIPHLKVLKKTVLTSRPKGLGEKIYELNKGDLLQKIDEVNGSFLVCIGGTCGYVSKDFVSPPKKG